MAIRDESKPYILDEPARIASKYGGNKQAIAQAAQTGQVGPTEAVLAGMFIDRMRSAAAQEQASNQTVAQRVFAPAAQPAGLGATAPAQQMAAAAPTMPAAVPQPPAQPTALLAGGGLADLPVPDSMFPDEYAGGGIVAFSAGSEDPISEGMFVSSLPDTSPALGREKLMEMLTLPELQEYNRSGKLPDRLRTALEGRRIADVPHIGNMRLPFTGTSSATEFVSPATPTAQPPAATPAQPPAATPAKPPAATPAAAPAKDDFQSRIDRFREMQKQFGVQSADDIFAEDKATVAKRLEELSSKGKKNEAISMIMAGLSGMNTKNLAEFAEKAGTAGFGQYLRGEKEIREDQRELDKINRDIRKATAALKRGDMETFTTLEDRIEQRNLQRMIANKPGASAEMLATYKSDPEGFEKMMSLRGGAGKLDVDRAKAGLAVLESKLLRMKKDDPKRKQLEAQHDALLERLVGMSGTGGSAEDPLGLRGGR